MTMQVYSAFPRAPDCLVSFLGHLLGDSSPLQRCNLYILQTQPTGPRVTLTFDFDSSDCSSTWFSGLIKSPCLIHSDDFMKKISFSLKMLVNVLTHLHAVLRMISIQQSWHYLCADFLHAQIFLENLPDSIFFHVQLICNHSNN